MLFSSPAFFGFFALYLLCHLLTPAHYRLLLIIVGSTIFYAYWNPWYVGVPYLLIVIAFVGVRVMDAGPEHATRRRRLVVLLIVLLAPLVFFKYANFLYQSVVAPWSPAGAPRTVVNVPLPLGISFITFSVIAYVVDVYRGTFPVERRLKQLVAYVVYFPHLIAGPILRPHELIAQLGAARRVTAGRVKLGATLFTVGLVKKLVVADQLSTVVERVYGNAAGLVAADYVLAIYAFSGQIYCDFSGYTDMAIGIAIVLGVRLPNNFDRPYLAASVSEFWRRWHITLSRWLRDYLYVSLGGNRTGFPKQMRNVMITMALGGLWHGANWTFVIWGVIHGAGIVLSHVARRVTHGGAGLTVPAVVGTLVTFHFVTLAWVFFRAPDVGTAWRILSGPVAGPWSDLAAFASSNAFLLLLLGLFLAAHPVDRHARFRLFVRKMPSVVVWSVIVLLWVLAITVSAGSSAKFIYFDF